jgi:Tol biopolymer transport system component
MNIDGSDVKQITSGLGYDGGAFFSPDGEYLLWRSSRPQTEEAQAQYKALLKKGLVQPTEMELYIAKADGSEARQITELGGANWAPFFHPSGDKVLFASNHHSKSGRLFNLFLMNLDGTGLEQVTFDNVFDSFPMFSFNGKKIAFSSNRGNNADPNAHGGATNVFVADWVD